MTRNNGVLALTTRRPGSSSASVPVWIRALSDTREKNPEVFSKAQASFWVRFGVMYNTEAGRVTWSLLNPKAVWLDFIGLAGTSTWQPNASRHSGGSTLERGPGLPMWPSGRSRRKAAQLSQLMVCPSRRWSALLPLACLEVCQPLRGNASSVTCWHCVQTTPLGYSSFTLKQLSRPKLVDVLEVAAEWSEF